MSDSNESKDNEDSYWCQLMDQINTNKIDIDKIINLLNRFKLDKEHILSHEFDFINSDSFYNCLFTYTLHKIIQFIDKFSKEQMEILDDFIDFYIKYVFKFRANEILKLDQLIEFFDLMFKMDNSSLIDNKFDISSIITLLSKSKPTPIASTQTKPVQNQINNLLNNYCSNLKSNNQKLYQQLDELNEEAINNKNLFIKIVLKNFKQNSGLEYFLNQFESELSNLNRLKSTELLQDSIVSNEQAIDIKNNLKFLINDLKLLNKFLSLPVFDLLNNENEIQLNQFIQTAQLSLIQACTAEFQIQDLNLNLNNPRLNDNSQNTDLFLLIKLCVQIVDNNPIKDEILQSKNISLIFQNLNKLVLKQYEQLLKIKSKLNLNEDLNIYCLSSFNKQLNLDLLGYISHFIKSIQTNKRKYLNSNLYELIFNLFKYIFLQLNLFNQNVKLKRNLAINKNNLITNIKNIDDPNTDDDFDNTDEDENNMANCTSCTTVTNTNQSDDNNENKTNNNNNNNNNQEESDDYLLIGSWLYDQINSNNLPESNQQIDSQPKIENSTQNEANRIESNSNKILDTTFDLDCENSLNQVYIDLLIDILSLQIDLLQDAKKTLNNLNINDQIIKDLSQLLIDIEAYEYLLSNKKFTKLFYGLVNILVIEHFDQDKQDMLLNSLNINLADKTWSSCQSLLINRHYLQILAQIYALRLTNGSKVPILLIWDNLLKNLESKIFKYLNQTEYVKEDLSIEFCSLLLFLFHNLNQNDKKLVLNNLANTIIDLNSKINYQDKLSNSPLLVSRLIFIFDYVINHFEEPSDLLINLMKTNLLNFNELDLAKYEHEFESLLKSLKAEHNFVAIIKPCFYKLKLKPIVIKESVLDILYKTVDYNSLYTSLVEFTYFGCKLNLNDKQVNELASISYNFELISNLLEPSLSNQDGFLRIPDEYLINILANFDQIKEFDFSLVLRLLIKLNKNASNQFNMNVINSLNTFFDPSNENETILKFSYQKIVDFFTNYWTKQIKQDIDLNKSIYLLNLTLSLFEVLLKDAKKALDLSNLEKLLIDLVLMYKNAYKDNFIVPKLNSSSFKIDNYLFSLLLNNSKCSFSKSQIDSCETSFLINFSSFQDEIFKDLNLNLKKINQDLCNKLDLINKYDINLFKWFSSEINYGILIKNMTKFLIDFHSNNKSLDSIFINLNGDLNLFYLYLSDNVCEYLSKLDSSLLLSKASYFSFEISFKAITYYYYYLIDHQQQQEVKLEKFFINQLKSLEKVLDTQYGLEGFLDFFLNSNNSKQDHEERLTDIFDDEISAELKQQLIENSSKKFLLFLLTSYKSTLSKQLFIQIISFLNKLLKLSLNSTENKQLTQLLTQLNYISNLEEEFIQKWLCKLIESNYLVEEHDLLNYKFILHQLVILLTAENSVINEYVCLSILNSLIPLSNKLINSDNQNNPNPYFADLLTLMDTLSSSGSGLGHLYLFKACVIWIEYYSSIPLNDSNTIQKSICYILSYLSQILNYLKPNSSNKLLEPTSEIQKYYQDKLIIDFDQKSIKLIEMIHKRDLETQNFLLSSSNDIQNNQDTKEQDNNNNNTQDNLENDNDDQNRDIDLDTDLYAETTCNNIDDTCNDQDQDDNYDLDNENNSDQDEDDEDDDPNENDYYENEVDDDEYEFDEQTNSNQAANYIEEDDDDLRGQTTNSNTQITNQTQPPPPPPSQQQLQQPQQQQQQQQQLQQQPTSLSTQQSQNSNTNQIDINELFGAYGVAYQIFDESENVLRNENRIDDEMDEDEDGDEEDPDEDDDDEYGDDFTDNFADYEHVQPEPPIRSTTTTNSTIANRDVIYQDLISTISAAAAAINGRIQNTIQNPSASTANSQNQAQRNTEANKTKTPKTSKNEDEDLNSKLCTYTITKKDFMNQHWYYCHTCKMIERIGMCTVCAKVCHKDHDISYAKFGSFFCDCGAKEDNSCKALVKRNQINEKKNTLQPSNQKLLKKRSKLNSVSSQTIVQINTQKENSLNELKKLIAQLKLNKPKQIEKIKQQILETIKTKNLLKILRNLIDNNLVPKAKLTYENSLIRTNSSLARLELDNLRSNFQNLSTYPEQLFQVTLGSQEGAFENVRLTYTGDHGPLIKQLIQTHSLRRVSMCLISSNKRKHLIVTHEKGKSSHLTILQLNALLKQDSNKRNKLTLTKLNTVPIPFTLVSVVSNQSNEDYVSLTGLKDCYIMYLNENGQTKNETNQTQAQAQAQPTNANAVPSSNQPTQPTEQAKPINNQSQNSGLIVLHPSLESSNYIIKSIWLPGSKNELALVTSEFVKIYDLSIDKISPIYYFVLPMGKIKDVTFFYDLIETENKELKQIKYIVLITSDGYLYYEELNDVSSAKNGVYYVTNTIDITNSNEQLGSGVSVYYSFKFKLLFWSHQSGKSYIGSLAKTDKNQLSLNKTFQLNISNNKTTGQALCNWTEIQSHPGLIMAMTLVTNNPIVLMFLPDRILYQEIKLVNNNGIPSKAKIQDMVAIRHPYSREDDLNENELNDSDEHVKEKTTMILLCDDGSLKIYVADSDKTEYWLKPYLKPTHPITQLKSQSQWTSASLYQLSPLVMKEVTMKKEQEKKDKQKLADLLKLNDQTTSQTRLKRSNTVKSKSSTTKKQASNQTNQNQFSIDYFEKCAQLNDIEYSGIDLLEIYNSQQLKQRLLYSNTQKYIVCKKQQGFKLEIINQTESNRMLLMGCRIMCGSHSIEKSPTYFEVFNRKIPVKLARSRWFDICLTREEAFISDNKLIVNVGPSSDTVNHVIMIDSVLCYGKSKQELNWTKQEAADLQKKYNERLNSKPLNSKEDKNESDLKIKSDKKATSSSTSFNLIIKNLSQFEPKPFDRLLAQSLDVYENGLLLLNEFESDSYKISLDLISLISPPIVLYKSKSLLFNCVKSNQLYNLYKDDSLINLINETLNKQNEVKIDSEMLEKCLLICKSLIQEKREINLVKFLNQKRPNFILELNNLFWNLINKSLIQNESNLLAQIGEENSANLNLLIECLIEIEHSFLLVELNNNTNFLNSTILNQVIDSYLKLLLSDSIEINLTARKCLIQLIKTSSQKLKSCLKQKPIEQQEELVEEEQESQIQHQNEPDLATQEITNNDDEMLQLAMQISLNEQLAQPASSSSQAPPAIQPRTLAPKTKARKTSLINTQSSIEMIELNTNSNLLKLRKILLENFSLRINDLFRLNPNINGLKSIGFFQFILVLMSDLNPKEDMDKEILEKLILNLFDLLEPFDSGSNLNEKTNKNEIKLICLRTLSILLSKSKYQRSGTDTCNFIIQTLIQNLLKYNLIDKCLNLIKFLYTDLWLKKTTLSTKSESDSVHSDLIKIATEHKFYDELSPYFVKTDPLNKDSFIVPPPNLALQQDQPIQIAQLPKQQTHQIDIFDNYIELLTEILIRLPYQMKKLCLGSTSQANQPESINQISLQFNFSSWTHYLCEYLLLPQCGFLKRLIKKLLQILCGSKDKYRKFKDQHILSTSINQLISLCPLSTNPNPPIMLGMGTTINEALESLNIINITSNQKQASVKISKINYLNLTKLVDNFKLILEVAASRGANWQKFCIQNPAIISYLIEMCLIMGVDSNGSGTDSSNLNSSSSTSLACTSVIVPTILQLLLSLFGTNKSSQSITNSNSLKIPQTNSSQVKQDSSKLIQKSALTEENLSLVLVNSLFKYVNKETLLKFIRSFLLEAYQSSIRWSMHSLIYNLYKNSSTQNQDCLYEILYSLWHESMTIYGSKSTQYVDLIGYIILKSSGQLNENLRLKEFLNKLIDLFKQQNSVLASHPNSLIYEAVRDIGTDIDGFYLEPEPCFICNNIETPIQTLKLNSIKIDTRFTTNQQIFKLSQTHSIQKIFIKITDIRKTKMIQTLNIYFTNRQSQSIVDLKMNLRLWSKAKQVQVEPGQSEIKIEFPLPIICSNLLFEYSDFYDRDSQTSSENAILQCPRCSASVPAHPGVCTTCGENVFQCHKCRAINYDERDPFLCNSCGYCKFAKFDINLIGKQYSSVDPIESEDDRKQTLQNINSLLDRADKIYSFMSNEVKPVLEALIIKLNEQNVYEKFTIASTTTTPPITNSNLSNPVQNPSGIIGIRMTPLTVLSGTNQPSMTLTKQSTINASKTIQSITQKYSECKTKFDELAKIVLKLNLSRKELREYDKQFKSINYDFAVSRKNSVVSLEQNKSVFLNSKSKCYGCASACIENCLTLFRVLLCSLNSHVINYVKSELCKNDILEDILNFNLKRSLNIISIQNTTTPSTNPTAPANTTTNTTTTTAANNTNINPTNPPTTAQPQVKTENTAAPNQKLVERDLINLVYLLLKDNPEGSDRFKKILLNKLEQFLEQPNMNCLIKNEIILLSSLIQKFDDSCWESRFRLVIHILLRSLNSATLKSYKAPNLNTTKIMDELTLPCLRILLHLSKTTTSLTLLSNQLAQNRASSLSNFGNQNNSIINNIPKLSELDLNQFMSSKSNESYTDKWISLTQIKTQDLLPVEERSKQNEIKLKYFSAWRKYTLKKRKTNALNKTQSISSQNSVCLTNLYDYDYKLNWLKICLFCPTNRAVRQLSANLIQNLFQFYSNSSDQTENVRKYLIVDLIAENLDELTNNFESHLEYLSLFKLILNDKESKYSLVIKHSILKKLDFYLQREIRLVSDLERLTELNTQSFNLGLNLNQGLTIKSLTDLLSIFIKEASIRNKFKSRLIATVLNSYLSLKKLLYQRTKLIDEAQEKLLSTLELLTTGTEQESRKFMSICIDTINNFDLDDLITPVFIFERLCNIIYPEEVVDNKEFLMILEKDPNQEDYLQGRMLGNPYSSNDPGLGPLMRNIKNKICTDSELIALLEDDNGMELLVNNKIISLDLNVRDVYKKVWLAECLSEHEPMRIVYRMTGLLGDATEDIIDNLEPKNADSTKNEEVIYRMADELVQNGALPVMLERLGSINEQNFTFGKPLLRVLLKLFDYAIKLKVNREVLIKPEIKTISTMLQTLNMMLKLEVDVNLAEKLISIMQIILAEASKQTQEVYNEFSALCGDREQLEFLLDNIKSKYVRSHSNLLQTLMGLIPFLSFGDETKMKSLIEYFSTYISNFDCIDDINANTKNEDLLHLECFCVIVNEIEIGENGKRLRDMMHSSGILQKSIEYLLKHSPKITTYLNSDYDLWKDFINRNSLPYVLRILTGLCRSHEAIQDAIGESCIPLLHKLEQFSSGNLVGVLSEDLLVALKQNPSSKVAAAIEEVRTQTKNEKKKLAMAMRKKQLNQLGMRTNEKGQLLVNTESLKNLEVEEEKGHICCICREGYKYHPQKVLAIYTFSKKVDLEPLYEAKTRKTVGYTTVTHFNLVHIDCHTNAIRSSRTCRDEWENAALQNANTKCNGILPIWGPDVTETLFSNALARHNNYLLEATGIRDINYILYVHDLKLLFNRFAENLSFSEDTGGGGRESNINLVPYLIHSILYSINTAKYVQREERNLNSFIESQNDKLIHNSFECDNVFYYLALSLVIMKPNDWKTNKLKFFKRVLLTCHSRLVNSPTGDKTKLSSLVVQDFKKYKPSLLYIGLVNLFFKHMHFKISGSTNQELPWTENLANYIRHNDIALMEYCKTILKEFEEELLVCEDWLEMFDVLGYLQEFEINEPLEFINNYLQTINN